MDEALVASIKKLLKIQNDIDAFNEDMLLKVLVIERKCNEKCKPLYNRRNALIQSIPRFWRIAFAVHPVLGSLLQQENDFKIFDYFTSLDVEEFTDGKSGYSITFKFKDNPHFQDNSLSKTFTYLDNITTKVTATPIKWNEVPVPDVAHVKKKPMGNQSSFFTWFTEEKEILDDEIADIIKEDLWPNLLSYFKFKVTEKGELDDNQDEEIVRSFEKVLEIQDDIEEIHKDARDKVLAEEQSHNEKCKDAYNERNEIIKTINDFWPIAFLSHPVLSLYIKEEDEKIIEHLTSLEVKGTEAQEGSGYSIIFNFETNPYFENTTLTKTFTFIDKRSTKTTCTPIKWKKGMVPNIPRVKIEKMMPMSDDSFFSWFDVVKFPNNYVGLDDEIADSIKEDMWRNPLSYFYAEPDGDENRVLSRGRAKYLRMIKLSKYFSEAQKHHFLEGKRHGSSPDLALPVAKLIQKYRNPRPSETNEAQEAIIIHADMKLITQRMFGRPVVNSFSKMISKYYKDKYDVDLHVVEVSQSSEGQSVSPDRAQCAKWFHVNFKANVKDVDSEYFAEIVVFKFRFTPLQCYVSACLPVNVSGNSCICSFQNPCPKVLHPSLEAFHDSYVIPEFTPLRAQASQILEELAGNKRRMKGGPIFAFLTSPSLPSQRVPMGIGIPASKEERGEDSGGELNTYLYRSRENTRMSTDIPVPKTNLLWEGKRQETILEPRRERAFAMAKRIKEYDKPKPSPTREEVIEYRLKTKVLPPCYRRKYGGDFEAINGLLFCEASHFRARRKCTWLHINFKAKLKDDGGGGDSEKLYFAEVIEVSTLSHPVKYFLSVCVPLDENSSQGCSSKCAVCNTDDVQICHPNPESCDLDFSALDPSKYPPWNEAGKFLNEILPDYSDSPLLVSPIPLGRTLC